MPPKRPFIPTRNKGGEASTSKAARVDLSEEGDLPFAILDGLADCLDLPDKLKGNDVSGWQGEH